MNAHLNIPADYLLTACPGDEALAEDIAESILGDRFDDLYAMVCHHSPDEITVAEFVDLCKLALH